MAVVVLAGESARFCLVASVLFLGQRRCGLQTGLALFLFPFTTCGPCLASQFFLLLRADLLGLHRSSDELLLLGLLALQLCQIRLELLLARLLHLLSDLCSRSDCCRADGGT